jgi:hypothetical protein
MATFLIDTGAAPGTRSHRAELALRVAAAIAQETHGEIFCKKQTTYEVRCAPGVTRSSNYVAWIKERERQLEKEHADN